MRWELPETPRSTPSDRPEWVDEPPCDPADDFGKYAAWQRKRNAWIAEHADQPPACGLPPSLCKGHTWRRVRGRWEELDFGSRAT